MTYRLATLADAKDIAALHTANWQSAYRGMLSDHYLDEVAPTERQDVWHDRLSVPERGQWVLVAKHDEDLVGFICIRRFAEPEFGALLDNLHVNADQRGSGIGKKLMQHGAEWLHGVDPSTALYLYVLVDNFPAIQFYDRLGGKRTATIPQVFIGGNNIEVHRYVWQEPMKLLED